MSTVSASVSAESAGTTASMDSVTATVLEQETDPVRLEFKARKGAALKAVRAVFDEQLKEALIPHRETLDIEVKRFRDKQKEELKSFKLGLREQLGIVRGQLKAGQSVSKKHELEKVHAAFKQEEIAIFGLPSSKAKKQKMVETALAMPNLMTSPAAVPQKIQLVVS